MSTAKPAREPLPRGYWTIWTTVAIDLIGFGIVAPLLPLYAKRFGASGLATGALFASFSLAQMIFAPLLGRLSDRIGRKPVIIMSLFGTMVGSLLTGLAGSLPMLFVGRLVDGASGASVSVAQGAVVDISPVARRAKLLGMLSAAFGVGFVLGPAIGGLASLGNRRLPFFVAAAISGTNGLVALRRLPETRGVSARDQVATASSHRPDLVRLAAIGFFSISAFGAFEAMFSRFGSVSPHRRLGVGGVRWGRSLVSSGAGRPCRKGHRAHRFSTLAARWAHVADCRFGTDRRYQDMGHAGTSACSFGIGSRIGRTKSLCSRRRVSRRPFARGSTRLPAVRRCCGSRRRATLRWMAL